MNSYFRPMGLKSRSNQKAADSFSKKEIDLRVKAAVQGAFNTPPKPLKGMTPKRLKTQQPNDNRRKGRSKTR
jgi:hypothetical protein